MPRRSPAVPEHRVLVVDDVPENLQVIGSMLDGTGIALSFATSGAQALRSVEVTRPDLVLLDVAMPDMDGYEVARRLHAMAPFADTPVIFLTARARPEDVVSGFRAGAVDYVTKPFNTAELIARVSTHLELKRSRDTIVRQNEDLRSLNATKDRFLSIVAHDLKNPLHGIISLSELVLDMGGQIDEATRGYVASMNATAKQMAKSLNDLLDWARVQRGAFEWKPEPFDLGSVVEESLLLMQSAAASKEVTVTSRVPKGERVHADPIMILTVVRNLLQNAVKYSPRGSEVTLGSERTDPDAVRVTVSDSGIGMSPTLVASLFLLDSRTSRPGTEGERGTGLGLKFCHEFLARHGSTLQVQSEEGKGTTFSFMLPRA
jgi:two-component system, sensor histidine kinase and response regulator